MEKYTKWRDPSTGIAPFLPPVPPAQAKPLLLLIPRSIGFAFGIVKTVLVVILLFTRALLSVVLDPIPWILPTLDRLALLLLGYVWINVEVISNRTLSRGSLPKQDVSICKGDIIISNWTSYIDVLYLAFRYRARFLLPHEDNGLVSFTVAGPIRMILQTGSTPAPSSKNSKTLAQIEADLQSSGRVGVLFAEATTSNNRGILKFATFSPPPIKSRTRYHIVAFKHPPPSPIASSSTAPVPTSLNPLGHIFQVCCAPLPRYLLVKVSSGPLDSGLTGAEARLGEIAKLKKCAGLGWQEKIAFLDMYIGKRKVKSD